MASSVLSMGLGLGALLFVGGSGPAAGQAQETTVQETRQESATQTGEARAREAAGEEAQSQEAEAENPEVPPRRRARRAERERASLELSGAEVSVAWGAEPAKGPHFDAVETLRPGDVIRFPGFAAVKLTTPVDLLFGELRVEEGNAAEDYPGVYSLWIERAEDGWRLVFNHRADVWGTQYDPSADAGRVALAHARTDEEAKTLAVELVETEGGGGLLGIGWGSHRWSVPFSLAPGG
jgi:hypothetical protein